MKTTMTKVLLFISESSIYFQITMEQFQKLLKALEQVQPFTSKIIDVNKDPEMAEKYKIDALPTIIIDSKRFIGQPDVDKIMEMIQSDK